MFTGLVEGRGVVRQLSEKNSLLQVVVETQIEGFKGAFGDSIAVNGVCLTVTNTGGHYAFDVSRETLKKTTLGQLKVGDEVNLERAMQLSDRLAGHLVAGHVDGVAEIKEVAPHPQGRLITLGLAKAAAPYLVPKGSICLDGVSLTINELRDVKDGVEIDLMLIPVTLEKTILGNWRQGFSVNYELDLVGKYIVRQTHLQTSR